MSQFRPKEPVLGTRPGDIHGSRALQDALSQALWVGIGPIPGLESDTIYEAQFIACENRTVVLFFGHEQG